MFRQFDTGAFAGLIWEEQTEAYDLICWQVNINGGHTTVPLAALKSARIPDWVGWPDPVNPPEGDVATIAVGWPLRCLRTGVLPNDDGFTRTVWGGLRIDRTEEAFHTEHGELDRKPYRVERWPEGVLPTSIIWPGFLADTTLIAVLYATLLAALWAIYASFLRRLRRRVGRCTRCGYSRAGLALDAPCPECGAKPSLPSAGPTSAASTGSAGG